MAIIITDKPEMNVINLGDEINVDQLAAITSSNSPSGSNPFATINDIGGGDFLPLAGGTMTGDIIFGTAGQYVGEGNFDTERGGVKGLSLVCSVGYEFNWQAGWLATTEQNSSTIRPLYLDSLAGTTLRVWDSAENGGIEISHTGITFPDTTTLTSANYFDQSLNTSDGVSFNSTRSGSVYMNGSGFFIESASDNTSAPFAYDVYETKILGDCTASLNSIDLIPAKYAQSTYLIQTDLGSENGGTVTDYTLAIAPYVRESDSEILQQGIRFEHNGTGRNDLTYNNTISDFTAELKEGSGNTTTHRIRVMINGVNYDIHAHLSEEQPLGPINPPSHSSASQSQSQSN